MMSSDHIFRNLPVLETSRLKLRKLSLRDASDVFEYACSPEVAEHVSWDFHRNISDSVHFLRIIIHQYKDGIPSPWGIVIKENGKLIGTIGFHTVSYHHSYGEVGYALSADYWGKGLMPEALREVVNFGFENLKLNRIEATCKLKNHKSERVMLKCGFKFEGILRSRLFAKNCFHDLKMYALIKSDYLNP